MGILARVFYTYPFLIVLSLTCFLRQQPSLAYVGCIGTLEDKPPTYACMAWPHLRWSNCTHDPPSSESISPPDSD